MRNPHFILLYALLFAALVPGCAPAEEPGQNLLPLPQSSTFTQRTLRFARASLDMPHWQEQWGDWLAQNGVAVEPGAKVSIRGELVQQLDGVPQDNDEAYTIDIADGGIRVRALSPKGLYWALQTLAQLPLPQRRSGLGLPQGHIADWPAFPYRGVMMDVGRTYISMEELKREIALFSRFKINVFHWHLTENQSWRMQSRLFPQLNDSANTTRMPGCYYTIDQARELVEHARAHNVLLIPEFDMPGHSEAFRRTFGCDMQSEPGMKILMQLMDEVCATFDVPYLHIGTDEVGFSNSDFVPRMVSHLRSRGKKVISWAPGWRYAPGEADLLQMWSYRGAPLPGIKAVDSRFHYLNHFDVFADLVALYRSSVYGRSQADSSVVGAEVALWNDRYVDDERSLLAQNNLYAATVALAERTWRGGGEEYFNRLGTNLRPDEADDFAAFADFERRLLWHKERTLAGCPIPYVQQCNVHWHITDPFPNEGDLGRVFPPEVEEPDSCYQYEGRTYGVHRATGAGIYLRHVWGNLVPAFYSDPRPNSTAYAHTWVYSPKECEAGMLVEFQNYSRSEPDLPPPPGCWDFRRSRLWLNGEELLPPAWSATHTVRSNETPLGNENFAARPPLPVTLHKGWNRVLIKLPVGAFSTADVRLVKWMFTALFTTPDGSRALPGLVYSPEKSERAARGK